VTIGTFAQFKVPDIFFNYFFSMRWEKHQEYGLGRWICKDKKNCSFFLEIEQEQSTPSNQMSKLQHHTWQHKLKKKLASLTSHHNRKNKSSAGPNF
jgi:hypothetical protein